MLPALAHSAVLALALASSTKLAPVDLNQLRGVTVVARETCDYRAALEALERFERNSQLTDADKLVVAEARARLTKLEGTWTSFAAAPSAKAEFVTHWLADAKEMAPAPEIERVFTMLLDNDADFAPFADSIGPLHVTVSATDPALVTAFLDGVPTQAPPRLLLNSAGARGTLSVQLTGQERGSAGLKLPVRVWRANATTTLELPAPAWKTTFADQVFASRADIEGAALTASKNLAGYVFRSARLEILRRYLAR